MINVGEYIRTDKGVIFEFQKIDDDLYMWGTDYHGCYEKDIKKHSKNIIDLIEVGDIVNGEEIEECKIINNKKIAISETCYYTNKDIKTILTHEMYNQNCYKVGEN